MVYINYQAIPNFPFAIGVQLVCVIWFAFLLKHDTNMVLL